MGQPYSEFTSWRYCRNTKRYSKKTSSIKHLFKTLLLGDVPAKKGCFVTERPLFLSHSDHMTIRRPDVSGTDFTSSPNSHGLFRANIRPPLQTSVSDKLWEFDGENALSLFFPLSISNRSFFFLLHYSVLRLISRGEPGVAWKTYCAGRRCGDKKADWSTKVKGSREHAERVCLLFKETLPDHV